MRWISLIAVALLSSVAPASAVASDTGRVIGIGGLVVASKHPHALAAWYRETLGMPIQSWGGAMFVYDATRHPPYALWSTFPNGAKEFDHSRRGTMLILSVDDLDALCRRLGRERVSIYERQSTAYGKFASIVDPDGTKLELWQAPKR